MRGISIVSKNNYHYFYNDETGFIELENQTPPTVNIPSNNSKEKEEIHYATVDEIKEYLLSGSGFRQLILEVTQSCNLRCKYCCFSDHYKSTRTYTSDMMSFDTGKKAIDYYVSLINEESNYINPCKNPSIGFYGGEPLLNFNLIKNLLEYIKSTYPQYKFNYNITTNGLLLSEEVGDFLVKNDFSILVSLDGDKENHDRNRVKPNGEGSFNEVMNNINKFKERHPDYFKFSFSTCYDYHTDLEKVKEFMEDNKLFVVSLSMISGIETDYYDKFTEEDKDKFYKTYSKLQEEFFQIAKKGNILKENYYSIYLPLFAYGYFELNNHSLCTNPKNKVLPFTSSCIPGAKFFVDTSGNIHMCERISNHFPIGHIDRGLDYDKITQYVNIINKNQKACINCNVSRLCNICFSQMTCNDKLNINSEMCSQREDDCKIILKNYIDILEENKTDFLTSTSNHISDMVKKTNSSLF